MSVPLLHLPTESEAQMNQRTSAVRMLSEALRAGDHVVQVFPGTLLRAIRFKAWESFETPLGNIYSNKNMAEWIKARPPQGLGSSVERVRQILAACDRNAEALTTFDLNVTSGPDKQQVKTDNVRLDLFASLYAEAAAEQKAKMLCRIGVARAPE